LRRTRNNQSDLLCYCGILFHVTRLEEHGDEGNKGNAASSQRGGSRHGGSGRLNRGAGLDRGVGSRSGSGTGSGGSGNGGEVDSDGSRPGRPEVGGTLLDTVADRRGSSSCRVLILKSARGNGDGVGEGRLSLDGVGRVLSGTKGSEPRNAGTSTGIDSDRGTDDGRRNSVVAKRGLLPVAVRAVHVASHTADLVARESNSIIHARVVGISHRVTERRVGPKTRSWGRAVRTELVGAKAAGV
jgi:hypothetical protein